MPRGEWDRLSLNSTGPVPIDITQTPLGSVSSDASVVAAVAYQYSSAWGDVAIYRHDEKDQPTPINVDHYAALLDIGSHPQLPSLIRDASTEDNENLRAYLADNVFLVKRNPGPDHWLPDLPASIKLVISSASSSG